MLLHRHHPLSGFVRQEPITRQPPLVPLPQHSYEFSPADLRVAANVVDANMGPDATAAGLKLEWDLFHGMLENAL